MFRHWVIFLTVLAGLLTYSALAHGRPVIVSAALVTLTPSPGPSPTNGPSPTITLTPSATATPVQTVFLLPNHTFYASDIYTGSLVFIGELLNQTPNVLTGADFELRYYLAGKEVGGANVSLQSFWYILPNEKQCFAFYTGGPPFPYPEFDDYTLVLVDYALTGNVFDRLDLSDFGGNAGDSNYLLTGEIQNTYSYGVNEIKTNATLYDASGGLVDCASYFMSHPNNFPLDAGETLSAEFDFTHRASYADVVSFEVYAAGRRTSGTFTPSPTNTPTLTPTPTSTPSSTPTVTLTPTPDSYNLFLPIIERGSD